MKALIDSHTHLETFHQQGVLPEVLDRARSAGVERLVTVGTGIGDWELYRKLAVEHPGCIDFTVGMHPCDIGPDWEEQFVTIEPYFDLQPRPIALGEIGLDRFHLSRDPELAETEFARQKAAFRAQLSVAAKLGVPVIVHSRGAFAECVELVDESDVLWERVVFHCFTEGAAAMRQLMERGGQGSFTGILTYKNAAEVREAALAQGLDRLMIETDAPFLTPVPYRGKPNEPAYLRATAEFAAQLFEVSLDVFAARTAEATCSFYGIKG